MSPSTIVFHVVCFQCAAAPDMDIRKHFCDSKLLGAKFKKQLWMNQLVVSYQEFLIFFWKLNLTGELETTLECFTSPYKAVTWQNFHQMTNMSTITIFGQIAIELHKIEQFQCQQTTNFKLASEEGEWDSRPQAHITWSTKVWSFRWYGQN